MNYFDFTLYKTSYICEPARIAHNVIRLHYLQLFLENAKAFSELKS